MLGEFGAVGKTLERFEQLITPPLPDADEEYYAWSAYPLGLFLEGLNRAMRYLFERDAWSNGSVFLDVGCGIGTKLAIATNMGWRVKGLEMYPAYAEVCRRVVPSAPVMVTNAFDWDDYDADLVYTYRLCATDEEQERLVTHITDRMRPGALLFAPGSRLPDEWAGRQLSPNLYRV